MLSTVLFLVAAVLFLIDAIRNGSLVSWGLTCTAAALAVPGLAAVI